MARTAAGSGIAPSAVMAARATRGSVWRSSGCSIGTASAAPIRPSSRAPRRWTNQRESPTSNATRLTERRPKPTMIASARSVAIPSCSTETAAFNASTLATPTASITAWIAAQPASSTSPMSPTVSRIASDSPLRTTACAVELGPVLIRQKRLVVVRDEQRFGRGPEHLELSRSPEIGFAQEAARERQDTLLAILVRGNRVEDRGEAVRGLTIERERGRQQLRDLHIVERPGDAADDRHTGGVVVLALQHLHDDVRI